MNDRLYVLGLMLDCVALGAFLVGMLTSSWIALIIGFVFLVPAFF